MTEKTIKTIHMNDLSAEKLNALISNKQIIDVRTKEEYELNRIEGSILHPLNELESFNEQKEKVYYIYCKSGKRSAQACKHLIKEGYEVVNLDGGMNAYLKHINRPTFNDEITQQNNRKIFNFTHLQCPGPIVNVNKEIEKISMGEQIEIHVSDPGFLIDIQSWVKQTGHTLVNIEENEGTIKAIIQKETSKGSEVALNKTGTTIVLFSGELDKALAAFIIANGAKATGRDVTIFFTFWGLSALKKAGYRSPKKVGLTKLFDLMLPTHPLKMPLSKMNVFGLGNALMRYIMKQKNVETLPALVDQAIEQNVRLIACTMSMDVMGITKEELLDAVEYGGVGAYIGATEQGNHHIFI